jgi:dolichyl-phosphate beta-glucosyltransferase
MPRITIVLPCFEEAAQIARSLATLDAWLGATAEVIVVDDGSPDGTAARAAAYPSKGLAVRVQRLDANRGKGHAIRSAVPLVRTDVVVVLDADLAFDEASIRRAVDALQTCDLAVGNRRHVESRYSVPVRLFGFLYRRHLVGLAFNAFVRALLPVALPDTQCGLKAFRREALQRIAPWLTTDGFAIDVEMLLVARALGLRVHDVPVRVTYESARSSVRLLRSGGRMAAEIVRIALARAQGRYASTRLRAAEAAAQRPKPVPPPEESVR